MGFKINGLILLGLTIVMVGVTWMVFDGIIDNIIKPKYWISNVYLEFMQIEFNVIPTLLLVIGILLSVMGASSRRMIAG